MRDGHCILFIISGRNELFLQLSCLFHQFKTTFHSEFLEWVLAERKGQICDYLNREKT